MPEDRTPADWHKADVKAALEKAGWNLSQLSERSGLHQGTLRKVFIHSYPKAERIIAYVLGLKPEQIWPSRYRRPPCPTLPKSIARSPHASRSGSGRRRAA